MVKFCVITCYLRDGIVLWELQGQKCQQRVCQHTCWLKGAHPTMEDGEVKRKVCFSGRRTGCTGKRNILVDLYPSISTISMKHQNVVGATVGLINEGLKS